jgi:raffinose/stachyose/melibiose transport system permease protein
MRAMSFPSRKALIGVLMTIPALLLILMFLVVPLAMTVVLSFTNWNGISSTYRFVGLANYLFVVGQRGFGRIVLNTLLFLLIYVPVLNVLALLLALGVFHSGRIFGPACRTVIFFPNILAHAVIGFVWRTMYAYRGSLNQALRALHLGILVHDWIGDPTTVIPSVTASIIWYAVGYFMVIYLAGLTTIPVELHEVAEIEGANAAQRFWHVTMPLLVPVLKICTVLATTGMFVQFSLIFTLTGGGPGYFSQTLALQVYYYAYTSLLQGPGLALAMMLGVVAVSVALIELTMLRKKEEAVR